MKNTGQQINNESCVQSMRALHALEQTLFRHFSNRGWDGGPILTFLMFTTLTLASYNAIVESLTLKQSLEKKILKACNLNGCII